MAGARMTGPPIVRRAPAQEAKPAADQVGDRARCGDCLRRWAARSPEWARISPLRPMLTWMFGYRTGEGPGNRAAVLVRRGLAFIARSSATVR